MARRYFKSHHLISPIVYVQDEDRWWSFAPGANGGGARGSIPDSISTGLREIDQAEAEQQIAAMIPQPEVLQFSGDAARWRDFIAAAHVDALYAPILHPPGSDLGRVCLRLAAVSAPPDQVRQAVLSYAADLGWRLCAQAADYLSFAWGGRWMGNWAPKMDVTLSAAPPGCRVSFMATGSPSMWAWGNRGNRPFNIRPEGVADVFASGVCQDLAAHGATVSPVDFLGKPQDRGRLRLFARVAVRGYYLGWLALPLWLAAVVDRGRGYPFLIIGIWAVFVGPGLTGLFLGAIGSRMKAAWASFALMIAGAAMFTVVILAAALRW